jgi:hypothetical protein
LDLPIQEAASARYVGREKQENGGAVNAARLQQGLLRAVSLAMLTRKHGLPVLYAIA